MEYNGIPFQNNAPEPNDYKIWVRTSVYPYEVYKYCDNLNGWILIAVWDQGRVGNEEPTSKHNGILWIDTSTTPAVLKMYNKNENTWYVLDAQCN